MPDENPYRTLHARMSPPGAAWAEGFAAGRAAATPDPPGIGLVTVRYHGENGWWADSDDLAGWTATSDTLDSLRAKAREGVFMVTGKYPSLVHGMTTGNEGYDTFDLLTPLGAASPDERLREAVAALPQYVITIQDREGYTYERGCEGQPMNYTGVMLTDVEALVGELKDRAPTARETKDKLKDSAVPEEPGQPPWATDEVYAAERAEKQETDT